MRRTGFTSAPQQREWKSRSAARPTCTTAPTRPSAASSSTTFPIPGNVPLVADASSHFLSRPLDVAPLRPDLRRRAEEHRPGRPDHRHRARRSDRPCAPRWPTMFDYKTQADAQLDVNTPPTYAVYIAGLVFQWLKEQGGLAAMEQRNVEKAALLYDYVDNSGGFYANPVRRRDRSRMNVPFTLRDRSSTTPFLKQAEDAGHGAAEGAPLGGRHARVDLQRDAARRACRRWSSSCGLRAAPWLIDRQAAAAATRGDRPRRRLSSWNC